MDTLVKIKNAHDIILSFIHTLSICKQELYEICENEIYNYGKVQVPLYKFSSNNIKNLLGHPIGSNNNNNIVIYLQNMFQKKLIEILMDSWDLNKNIKIIEINTNTSLRIKSELFQCSTIYENFHKYIINIENSQIIAECPIIIGSYKGKLNLIIQTYDKNYVKIIVTIKIKKYFMISISHILSCNLILISSLNPLNNIDKLFINITNAQDYIFNINEIINDISEKNNLNIDINEYIKYSDINNFFKQNQSETNTKFDIKNNIYKFNFEQNNKFPDINFFNQLPNINMDNDFVKKYENVLNRIDELIEFYDKTITVVDKNIIKKINKVIDKCYEKIYDIQIRYKEVNNSVELFISNITVPINLFRLIEIKRINTWKNSPCSYNIILNNGTDEIFELDFTRMRADNYLCESESEHSKNLLIFKCIMNDNIERIKKMIIIFEKDLENIKFGSAVYKNYKNKLYNEIESTF